MKKNKIGEWISLAETFTKKNSPVILAGLAVAGMISTAYAAYKAGAKADKILAKKKQDMNDVAPGDKEAQNAVAIETVKEIVPVVIPPILLGAATTACIIGSVSASNRKIAALSAAYSISESAVRDLNGKMTEMLGEKKTRSIKDAIMKDKLDKGGKPAENSVILTGNGDVLCKDLYSGRYFRSSAEKIKMAINELSSDVISEMYVSLNDFYELVGIPRIPLGEDLGWNIDDTDRGKIPIVLTALLTEDNQPCLCVEYDCVLRRDYRNLH